MAAREMDRLGRYMLKRLCAAAIANRAENHVSGIALPIDVADPYLLAEAMHGSTTNEMDSARD
jgi:hypothetical protein